MDIEPTLATPLNPQKPWQVLPKSPVARDFWQYWAKLHYSDPTFLDYAAYLIRR